MPQKEIDYKKSFILLIVFIFLIFLVKYAIDAFLAYSKGAELSNMVWRVVFIILFAFIFYLIYKNMAGKKVATKGTKIIGWILAIPLILLGLFAVLTGIFLAIPMSIPFGIFFTISGLLILFLGLSIPLILYKKKK